MAEEQKTRSDVVAADVAALLRARNPLLWIETAEEQRVEGYLAAAASAAGYKVRTWDCAQGVANLDGTIERGVGGADIGMTLSAIRSAAEGRESFVWVMRDLNVWLEGPLGIATRRQLRNLVRYLPGIPPSAARQAIIVVAPSANVPDDLKNQATVINWPLPDRAEIGERLDMAIEPLIGNDKFVAPKNGEREAAIDAAIGLTDEEAAACFAKSIVQLKRIDPVAVAQEKKRVVTREGVLEWYDPIPGGLDAVGGLDVLKSWLVSRASAYTLAAREYGLRAPKGAVFVGVSGCGKSLLAKATATAWGVPLLKVDLGALKSKFVGDSEQTIRRALRVIDAIGRCVVWVDEIEKQMQGSVSGSSDGGVSADQLGVILNWMQERKSEGFVIATSNDVSQLPPELLRKGRFDDVWFVDLPNAQERASVMAAALRENGRDAKKLGIDLDEVAQATADFTGAEIASVVPDAMFAAFADNGRQINTKDLVAAAALVVPLNKTAGEKIVKLREWAQQGRARAATSAETAAPKKRARVVDL